jgi:two-component system sensor histidine kinase SenX3
MPTIVAVVVAAVAVVLLAVAIRQRRVAQARAATATRDLEQARAEGDRDRARLAEVRDALDALDIGVLLVDRDGVPILENAMARTTSPIEDALVRAAIERVQKTALAGQAQSELVRLSGPPARTLEVSGRAVADPSPHAALVVIADVTGRVRVDEVRRDFVANLSHELRSPLGAVGLLGETLATEDDPVIRTRLLGRIGLEVDRMTAIVDDLLDLSRLEFDGSARREPVSTRQVVEEAVDGVRHLADQRGVKIRSSAADEVADLDRPQVMRALANLLENAVKYSDHGSIVEIDAEVESPSVRFTIRDGGIGIPSADLERIFERFYRVDTARSRSTGGTGLGLSIVRHVAQNHGGEVLVTSREGEGSTFVLVLPAEGSHV